ncbi:unnamed protein product [Symbiodinium natans]|uniref:EF-hand domain-containing protein n=1 Tax=Symbiodinium natans TaxID=878477 RepID=A0A812JC92_9DINO|nr:unnamed protein product [Symbiodinium natans]
MIHGLLDQIQACVSDDDDEQPDVSFVLSGMKDVTCQTLVVCGPGPASAFALQAFNMVPLPLSLESKEDSPLRPLPPPRAPRFFKASDGAVVAVLETHVSGEYAAAWAEALLSALGGKPQVVYLDRILRAEWCSFDRCRPEEPYLAGLWTSAFSGSEKAVPVLPAPNFVEGLAAALLSNCEARSWPCLVALALQDGAHMSEGCLHAFEALVPMLLELQVISSWQRPKYREALQKVPGFVGNVSPSPRSASLPRNMAEEVKQYLHRYNTSGKRQRDLTEEQKQELKEVFDLYDTDGSAAIDNSELKGLMQVLGFSSTTREELVAMMMSVDKDGSGEIELDEFLQMMAPKVLGREPTSVIRKAFPLFVAEGSETITWHSLRALADDLGLAFSDHDIQEMLEDADDNGDGHLDEDEFVLAVRRAKFF